MFSITSINRRLKKERLGLTLGAVALILVLLASTATGLFVARDRERSILESHVSYTVKTMVTRFEDLVADGISQIQIAASGTNVESLRKSIARIAESNVFDGVAILNERGKVVYSAGEISEPAEIYRILRYPHNDVVVRINIYRNGQISISVDTDAHSTVQAWISTACVDEVFSEDGQPYAYCLFDASTGAYIVNRTEFGENSYYDSLLARNEKGRMEPLLNTSKALKSNTLIAGGSGGSENDYYIAQAGTDIGNITAAITVPRERLRHDLDIREWNSWVIGSAIGATVLVVLCAALLVFRHEHKIAMLNARSNRISDMLLHRASNGAKITLMLYDAASDAFSTYCESDRDRSLYGETDPANLREFALRYGISDEDVERMYATCRGLKPGERASMNLTSIREDGDRTMHLHMHSAEESGLVVCSMYDCTNEMRANERMQQEAAFRNSVLPKCMSCWDINVTLNSWQVSYCAKKSNRYMRELAAKAQEPRDYNRDLESILRTVVHPDDYQSYVSAASTDALMAMYHSGIVENVHEYRVRNEQKNGYEWHRQIVRMQKSMDRGDIIASLYIVNINAERVAETERRERNRILQQSLTALGGLYFALFYVDLDNDLCYTAKAPKGEIVSQTSGPYKDTLDAYIDKTIHPDDRERIRNALSSYVLRRSMTEGDHLVCDAYRRKVDDRYEEAIMLIQAARFENGTVRDVVVAMRNPNKTDA